MAYIKYIEDKSGTVFFPVVHENGVIDDNGHSLASKLDTFITEDQLVRLTTTEITNLLNL
jgi:hypothetical protein